MNWARKYNTLESLIISEIKGTFGSTSSVKPKVSINFDRLRCLKTSLPPTPVSGSNTASVKSSWKNSRNSLTRLTTNLPEVEFRNSFKVAYWISLTFPYCSPFSYRSPNFAIAKVVTLNLFASIFVRVL